MSRGSKFEVSVHETRRELQAKGYKVEIQEIHGHYQGSDGEIYNQKGYAIRVYPYVDRERRPMKTCHVCRVQVPHNHKGGCTECGAPAEQIYV